MKRRGPPNHLIDWGVLRWLTAGLAFLAALGVLWIGPATAAPTRARPGQMPVVGATPPEIGGLAVHGDDPLSLSRLQGRVVVLDFWATWCGPCRAVMPFLDRLHRQHHARGLSVLGLTSEPAAVVQRHLSRGAVGYTIGAGAQQTLQRYAIRGLPTLIVIGRDGKVRHVAAGASGSELRQVETLVEQLLAETP